MKNKDRSRGQRRTARWRRGVLLRCIVYLGVPGMLSIFGCFERLAFVPRAETPLPTPDQAGWDVWEDAVFPSRDGTRLHGWIIRGARDTDAPPPALVVHAHGNAGNMGCQLIAPLAMCLEYGCDALMFDYRSFGLSQRGALTRHTVVEDLAGALAFARERFPDTPLLLLGQSMGGATAALAMRETALRDAVAGLCLIAAFADWNVEVRDVLQSNVVTYLLAYPLAYTLISPFRAEPHEGLAAWPPGKPLLLIHGTKDTLVPIHHMDMLLAALPEPSRGEAAVVRVPHGTHNALGDSANEGAGEIRAALGVWIDRSVSAAAGSAR